MELKGWSEYKLAKAANLPQSTISHLFKRNNAPTFHTVQAICRAFSITMSQFFAEEGDSVVLTPEQQELLFLWGSLTDDQQRLLKETMKHFVEL